MMPVIIMHKVKQFQENGSMFTLAINKSKKKKKNSTHIYDTHKKEKYRDRYRLVVTRG